VTATRSHGDGRWQARGWGARLRREQPEPDHAIGYLRDRRQLREPRSRLVLVRAAEV